MSCLRTVCLLLACATTARAQPSTERYLVAELKQPARVQYARAQLARRGFRELGVLPGQRLLLERVASQTAADEDAGDTYALASYALQARVSQELLQPMAADVPVLIHGMPGAAAQQAADWLARAGLPLLGRGQAGESLRLASMLPAERAAELALALAGLPEVRFMERVHHVGLFNDRSAGTVQSGMQGATAAVTPIWEHGLHGEGQVLGIIDTGLDADSCWFSTSTDKLPAVNTWSQAGGYATQTDPSHSKVLAYDFLYSCDQWRDQRDCENPSQARAWDTNGHGTHCAGNMAGHRAMGGNNGMAPEAKLVIQDGGAKTNDCADLPGIGCPVVDLVPLFAQAYAQGVRIHNNSWGDNENAPTPQPSNYTARSQDVDRFVWEHKDMLLVFAAGNSGANDAEFSVCSPSTNKNGLSVGSVRNGATTNTDNDISSYSSRGWTADGRIKPEILAPGCNASAGTDNDNTTHNCTQNSGCGTSYASPTLVGAAGLARQYFTDGFYPSGAKNPADALQPTAALLKAVLINGAVPVTGKDNAGRGITPIPSNEQGWGRVQLDRALVFQGGARKLFADDHKQGFELGSMQVIRYEIVGVDPAEPLKLTLSWTDYPGMPDGAPRAPKLDDETSWNPAQLVNDLDLGVSDGAVSYLGNAFADGKSAPGGKPDRRNNVEQVLIDKPGPGPYTVTVSAAHILQGPQDFALVVTGKWQSAGPAGSAAQPSAAGSAAGAPAAGAAAAGGGAGAPASEASPAITAPALAGAGAQAPSSVPAAAGAGRAAPGTRTLDVSAAPPPVSAAAPSAPAARSGGCGVVHAPGSRGACWLAVVAAPLLRRLRRRAGSPGHKHGPAGEDIRGRAA